MADLLDTPQFQLPFRVDGPRVKAIEQGSDEETEQKVILLLRYRKRSRPGNPDFGILDQAFRKNGLQVSEVYAEVKKFVPEATPKIVKGAIDQITGEQVNEMDIVQGSEESRG
jgi:hypothetical protein